MINVGIVGGTGYTGQELLRLLSVHPKVTLTVVTSRSECGHSISKLFSSLRGRINLNFSKYDQKTLELCDLVFFATPNGVAMKSVPSLLEKGVKVIDLSADFRLINSSEWESWYKLEHTCPDILHNAVYGLPEIHRESIRQAQLISNPGCYPTATLLGLLPLIKTELLSGDIIVDAKSGVSGAGRMASTDRLMCEVSDSFKAYCVDGHRHLPEIRQEISKISNINKTVQFNGELIFVPHLVPMIRGIHITAYCTVKNRSIDLQSLFNLTYQNEPFVDVMPIGSHPETRSVRASNQCRIAFQRPQDGDIVVILSVIDNLVKGAAGQAIQNMNIMYNLDESCGLDAPAIVP